MRLSKPCWANNFLGGTVKLFSNDLPDFLESGERARLMPAMKDSNKEQKVTSSLLASIMAINEFGRELLTDVGAPAFKRAKINCYTEVVFKGKVSNKIRPDGLIVVEAGKKRWSALVEAKVGNNPLKIEQVEAYLELAKGHKIDALITISNQFASIPTHHPMKVSKVKTRRVSLYHWSWMLIMTKGILQATNKNISDPDQAFILEELIRYLQHPNSGVLSFNRMDSSWKIVCSDTNKRVPLKKNSNDVVNVVSNWHQLTRFLALQMSVAVGEVVNTHLTRKQQNNIEKYFADSVNALITNEELSSEFTILNAASRLKLVADLRCRTLSVSMRVNAPDDRKQVKSRLMWLIRQLSKCDVGDTEIRVIWQGRSKDTATTLDAIRNDEFDYTPPKKNVLPSAFEVRITYDLMSKFIAPVVFVDEAQKVLPSFYKSVGQYLRAWKPSPPKLKTTQPENILEGE